MVIDAASWAANLSWAGNLADWRKFSVMRRFGPLASQFAPIAGGKAFAIEDLSPRFVFEQGGGAGIYRLAGVGDRGRLRGRSRVFSLDSRGVVHPGVLPALQNELEEAVAAAVKKHGVAQQDPELMRALIPLVGTAEDDATAPWRDAVQAVLKDNAEFAVMVRDGNRMMMTLLESAQAAHEELRARCTKLEKDNAALRAELAKRDSST